MRRVTLGQTGIETSCLGFGCASLGSRVGEEAGLRALAAAHDAGVTWFDLAPLYGAGRAEEVAGRFLKGRPRASVQICSKVGLAPGVRPHGLKAALMPLARAAVQAVPSLRGILRRGGAQPAQALPLTPDAPHRHPRGEPPPPRHRPPRPLRPPRRRRLGADRRGRPRARGHPRRRQGPRRRRRLRRRRRARRDRPRRPLRRRPGRAPGPGRARRPSPRRPRRRLRRRHPFGLGIDGAFAALRARAAADPAFRAARPRRGRGGRPRRRPLRPPPRPRLRAQPRRRRPRLDVLAPEPRRQPGRRGPPHRPRRDRPLKGRTPRLSYGLETWRAVGFPPTGGKQIKNNARTARSPSRQRPRPAPSARRLRHKHAPGRRRPAAAGGSMPPSAALLVRRRAADSPARQSARAFQTSAHIRPASAKRSRPLSLAMASPLTIRVHGQTPSRNSPSGRCQAGEVPADHRRLRLQRHDLAVGPPRRGAVEMHDGRVRRHPRPGAARPGRGGRGRPPRRTSRRSGRGRRAPPSRRGGSGRSSPSPRRPRARCRAARRRRTRG